MRPGRLILSLGLSLALGLMTTVAVAWKLALAPIAVPGLASTQIIRPARSAVFPSSLGVANAIEVAAYTQPGRVCVASSCYGPEYPHLLGIRSTDGIEFSSTPPDQLAPPSIRRAVTPWLFDEPWPKSSDVDWRTIAASGWPLLALASEHRRTRNFTQENRFAITLEGRRKISNSIFGSSDTPRLLPLRPLWPGLLADTALFALPWWLLLQLPLTLRRLLRPAWACPTCRYDRRGLTPDSPCPECGRPA